MLIKPQLPPVPQVQPGNQWGAIWAGFGTLVHYIQALVLYLQTYLTRVEQAVNSSAPVFIVLTAASYTLPTAAATQAQYVVKNLSGGGATLSPNGSDTIDGGGAVSMSSLEALAVLDYAVGSWAIIGTYP